VELEEEAQKLVLLVEQERKGRCLRSPNQSPKEVLYCTFLMGGERGAGKIEVTSD